MATEDIDRSAVGALARTMIETKERLEGEVVPQSKEQVRAAPCTGGVRPSLVETMYATDIYVNSSEFML